MKIIDIVVSPNGATTIKTSGFAGGECREATNSLERALGLVQQETLTPEFHSTAEQPQRLNE